MTKILSKRLLSILFLVALSLHILAQKFTIHGIVSDAENGEALIGATVLLKETTTGVVTNSYGFYSLTLQQKEVMLEISYIGYETKEINLSLTTDKQLNVELEQVSETIEEVVIKSERRNQNITSTKIGVQKLDSKKIETIPVLFGEADVIKAIKLLPGVSTTSETSSNISVRGGSFDQNLILLDEATVYSASHMLGLFSVFNNDAIRNVEFYKGSFPAQYGGRLSSVIDIRMKEGSTKNFHGKGNVGLISTKLTLEVPIVKDKWGLLLSGRRTYFDLLFKGLNKLNDNIPELPYYFYDFNAKTNYKINDNNRVYLSGYFGRDMVKFNLNEDVNSENGWGNYTGTLRWNSIISRKLFMNTTLLTSKYDFKILLEQKYGKDDKVLSFNWNAFMKDYSAKIDFGYFLNSKNTIKFGGIATYHDYSTGQIKGRSDTISFDLRIPKYYALEYAGYLSNTHQITDRFKAEYGMRASFSNNLGSGVKHHIENYEVVGADTIEKNVSYNFDYGIEPRVYFTYAFDDKQSIKFGYARTKQYVQVASNSIGGTPIDVWMPVTNNIEPQYADQISGGYFRNFLDDKIQTSVELYYKRMGEQVEFRAFSEPYFNPEIEEDFRFGEGRAYGAEFYIHKPEGKLNGWISYTLSRSEKLIDDYWEKNWYLSSYDNTHNLSVVTNYQIMDILLLSATFVYTTGKPFDFPVSGYKYENEYLPIYRGKNSSRYPAYHRLDLGANWQIYVNSKVEHFINVSVYNAYNRKNANMIFVEADESDNYRLKTYKFSLLPVLVTAAYVFNF